MLHTLCYNKTSGLIKVEDQQQIASLLKNPRNLLWVDMTDPAETDIDLLVEVFEFHSLAIEDAIFPQNHPKLDHYDNHLFIVIHELSCSESDVSKIRTGELNIFFGKNYVVTIHADPLFSISKLFQRCVNKNHCMKQGSGILLHGILDSLVDGYLPVTEQLEKRIGELEEQLLAGLEGKGILETIIRMKKSLLTLRNFIVPQRKILGMFTRDEIPYIRRGSLMYFRDVYDHVARISDLLDTYRDTLNSAMEAYLSTVSNRLNEIMKTLTIITTMLMPLSVITSFYGMNVKLPEFEWGIKGYWVVLGLIAAVFFGMWFFIKQKKWI